MSLVPGARLGPYEIVGLLGAGGMGEVFRARDTRLGREVALKVIPEDLQGQPEVRARFEREARAASALNHPNICQVYDVGHEDGTEYIVMELIEGESLAQRLLKGPLPPPEVLRIGGQIADALDRAHRAGIIHRDLKPGNVMITKLGAKLLDFGLARPAAIAGPANPGTPSSPTMSRQLTADGSIVGTFMYMAPEQLEGSEADARSDLWALGATLYEMATGKPAFEGRSQASLIAAILGKEPRPISEVVPLTPPALDRVVQACLAKDPEDRIQSVADVKLQLKWIAEGGSQMGVPAPVTAHRKARERGAWIGFAISTLVALGALGFIASQGLKPKPVARPVRFVVASPPGTKNVQWPRLSPDGTMLMFHATDSTGRAIWVRPLASTTAYKLPGTGSGGRPFWSADSKEIGFFEGGKFKKIAVGGGPVQLVADAGNASDGGWAKGMVLFDAGVGDSIRGIPASGGEIVPASTLDRSRGENQHAWPVPLPDGKHFLYQAFRLGSSRMSYIRLGTVGSLKSVVVDSSQSRAEFLPPNHLVYVRDGAVIARKFDLAKGSVVGDPIVIGENAGTSTNTESFTVSSTGMVAFQSSGTSRFVVNKRDRTGRVIGQVVAPGANQFIALSPDGKKLVVCVAENSNAKSDLWIKDLERGTMTRFTFDPGDEIWPVWSPDGQTIAYSSDNSAESYQVWTKPSSGITEGKRLEGLKLPFCGPTGFSADGKLLLVSSQDAQTGWNVWGVPLSDPAHPIPIATTTFIENIARLSPDGRFVTYASDQSGPSQIFVQPFPNATARWQLADGPGLHPYWTRNGHEIIYRGAGGMITAVPVTLGADGTFEPGTALPLFVAATSSFSPGRFVPSADGETIYTVDPESGQADPFPITVLLDANAELARR